MKPPFEECWGLLLAAGSLGKSQGSGIAHGTQSELRECTARPSRAQTHGLLPFMKAEILRARAL